MASKYDNPLTAQKAENALRLALELRIRAARLARAVVAADDPALADHALSPAEIEALALDASVDRKRVR